MTTSIRAIRGALRRSDRLLKKKCHLNASQVEIMQVIEDAPGSSQDEIALAADVDVTTTGQQLRRFHQEGWIDIKPKNKRTNSITLTTRGRAKLKSVIKTITKLEEDAAQKLGIETLPEFAQVLNAFAQNAA